MSFGTHAAMTIWTDALTPVRLIARGVALILLTVLGTPLTVLCLNRAGASIRVGDRFLDEVMLNWWTGMVCRVFGVRVRVSGHVSPGPVLMAANHVSWMDIVVMHSAAAVGFVSKAEVADYPLIGFLARVSGTVFHERGSHHSSSNVAGAMVRRFEEGGRIAIFPEGGIRPGEGVKLFHARLFGPAIEAGCPVQPVMIRYLRKGRLFSQAGFEPGEGFLHNFVRQLGRPACTCDLRFLPPVRPRRRPRKVVAGEAQKAVERAFATPTGAAA